MILYFDGGSKPNPGTMSVGVVIKSDPIQKFKQEIGYGTNNIAEWVALLWAIDIAHGCGAEEIDIYGDSLLIVNQANGKWKIKQPEFLIFKQEFDKNKKLFKHFGLYHVLRDKNLAGVMMEFG